MLAFLIGGLRQLPHLPYAPTEVVLNYSILNNVNDVKTNKTQKFFSLSNIPSNSTNTIKIKRKRNYRCYR